MGRVKYRGHENSDKSRNGIGAENNNKNISSNGNKSSTNGRHNRSGVSKHRSKPPPSSALRQSPSFKVSVVCFALGIALLCLRWLVFPYAPNLLALFRTSTGLNAVRLGPGGWRLASEQVLREYDPGICSVERVSVTDLSPERFESEFRFKKPVLVTFPGGSDGWTDARKWGRESLVEEYSDWTIRSGDSLDIVRKGGNPNHRSSFLTFVERLLDNVHNGTEDAASVAEPINYAFDRHFYWESELPETLKLPPYFHVKKSEVGSIFFLGSSLTGVVFHKHSDTWNGVVYGRKRWFLYPSTQTPPGGVHHGYTLLEWVNHVYPNLTDQQRPMECVQEPGEILYLPEGTYHATLNLGDTVALAIQKTDAQLETEILFYEATDLIEKLQKKPPKVPEDKRNVRLLEVYKELHDLLPGNAEVMMKIGFQLYDMNLYAQSIPWHLKAIKKEPYFILAYIHLAMTYAKLKRYDEAEELFLSAMKRSPNFWDIYKEYGEFLYKRGRVADALPIYKRGTELKPEMIPFWYFYKVCQEQVGDKDGAEATSKIIDELTAQQEAEG